MVNLKTISILGCGWFGFPLASELVKDSYFVRGATTTPNKLEKMLSEGIVPYLVQFDPEFISGQGEDFFKCDILLVNIPPRKNGEKYRRQADSIAGLVVKHKIREVIFISSTSVYGDLCQEVDEDTVAMPETGVGVALRYAEELFLGLNSVRTTIVRFAGLIGPGRDPGRFFAGKTDVPNGRAPVNLIHLDDCLGLVKALLKEGFPGGIINACSPDHPTRQAFYISAARSSGLPLPTFKDELLGWKIIRSRIIGREVQYEYKMSSML